MDSALNLRDIEKITEQGLASVQFASEELYHRVEDLRTRFLSLDKAFSMSRSEKVKTLLVINTIDGFKAIETKVLSLNAKGIIISGNIFIPMHAIYNVIIE